MSTRIVNRNKDVPEGGQVIWTPSVGGLEQHKANMTMFNQFADKFNKARKNLSDEQLQVLSDRASNAVDNKGRLVFPEGIDLSAKNYRGHVNTYEQRAALADIFAGRGVGGEKGRTVAVEKMLGENLDPYVADVPTGSLGNRIFTLDNNVIVRPDLHGDYPYILTGEDLGLNYIPVPRESVMETFANIPRFNKKGEPRAVTDMDYRMGDPTQLLHNELLSRMQSEGLKGGGLANLEDVGLQRAEGGEVDIEAADARLAAAMIKHMDKGGLSNASERNTLSHFDPKVPTRRDVKELFPFYPDSHVGMSHGKARPLPEQTPEERRDQQNKDAVHYGEPGLEGGVPTVQVGGIDVSPLDLFGTGLPTKVAGLASMAGKAAGKFLSPKAGTLLEDYMVKSGMQLPATVWHGSPHKFPPTAKNPLGEFDSSKIGTGEGAQAYGMGHYTAGAKEVGQQYKTALESKARSSFKTVKGETGTSGMEREAADIAHMMQTLGPVERGWLGREINARGLPPEAAKLVKSYLKGPVERLTGGALYKIELPNEQIAKMLDWDKPLSEQPNVIKALKGTGYDVGISQKEAEKIADMRLRQEANEWAEETGGDPFDYSNNVDWEKYVDQVRKDSGSIDSNITGKELHRMVMRDDGYRPDLFDSENYQVGTSETLRGMGIPGIRYLDGSSRKAGEGSSNYVVFPGNEDMLNIISREKDGGAIHMDNGGEAFKKLQFMGGGGITTSGGYFSPEDLESNVIDPETLKRIKYNAPATYNAVMQNFKDEESRVKTPSGAKDFALRVGANYAGMIPDLINLGLMGVDAVADTKLSSEKPWFGSEQYINAMHKAGMLGENEFPIAEIVAGILAPAGLIKKGVKKLRNLPSAKEHHKKKRGGLAAMSR
jgi:hypothetical protein